MFENNDFKKRSMTVPKNDSIHTMCKVKIRLGQDCGSDVIKKAHLSISIEKRGGWGRKKLFIGQRHFLTNFREL